MIRGMEDDGYRMRHTVVAMLAALVVFVAASWASIACLPGRFAVFAVMGAVIFSVGVLVLVAWAQAPRRPTGQCQPERAPGVAAR